MKDYAACIKTNVRIYQEVQQLVEDLVAERWEQILGKKDQQDGPRRTVSPEKAPVPASKQSAPPAKHK